MAESSILEIASSILGLNEVLKKSKDKKLIKRVDILWRTLRKVERKLDKGKLSETDYILECLRIRSAIKDAWEDLEKVKS
jgi:hypothetical protein